MSSASLLRKAAEVLDDGCDPMMNPFLADNDVSLDQLYSLAEHLAIGARLVAQGIERPSSPAGMAMLLLMAEGL